MLEEHNLRQLLESRGQVYIDNPIVKLIDTLKTDYNFYFDIDKGPWIAGGAVRKLILNEPLGEYSDIDFIFS